MRVVNWTELSLKTEDISQLEMQCHTVKSLSSLARELIRLIIQQYPWDGRDDLIELYDPSKTYQPDQAIAFLEKDKDNIRPDIWRIAKVLSIEDDTNPIQGDFSIMQVQRDEKTELWACGVPDATAPGIDIPEDADDTLLDMLIADVIKEYGDNIKAVIRKAIEDDESNLAIFEGNILHIDQIVDLSESDIDAIRQSLKGAITGSKIQPKSSEELVHILTDNSDISKAHEDIAKFSINIGLSDRPEDFQYVLKGWVLRSDIEEAKRKVQKRPSVPYISSKVAQELHEEDVPVNYDEVKLEPQAEDELKEMGEVDEKDEIIIPDMDSWRAKAKSSLRLPPLTYQNIYEGFLPLTKELRRFFPPYSLFIDMVVIDGEPLQCIVNYDERIITSLDDEFRTRLINQEPPLLAGTYLWIERQSDTTYRIRPKRLRNPKQVNCKRIWLDGIELKCETIDMPVNYESDSLVLKSEIRFDEVEALFVEAERLDWSIFDAIWHIFPEITDTDGKVHWKELFNAVFFRQRMCSPRSILTELYFRPCFVSQGGGYWIFQPELGITRKPEYKIRHSQSTDKSGKSRPKEAKDKDRLHNIEAQENLVELFDDEDDEDLSIEHSEYDEFDNLDESGIDGSVEFADWIKQVKRISVDAVHTKQETKYRSNWEEFLLGINSGNKMDFYDILNIIPISAGLDNIKRILNRLHENKVEIIFSKIHYREKPFLISKLVLLARRQDRDIKLFLEKLSHYPFLEYKEELLLILLAQQGNIEARNRIVLSYMQYVVNIAAHYLNADNVSISFMELIQEGCIGLIEAINKYEPARSRRLYHYAHWWIKQRITRSITGKLQIIDLPVHVHDKIDILKKARKQLESQLMREVTAFDISELLNVDCNKVEKLMPWIDNPFVYLSQINEDNDIQDEVFLTKPVNEDICDEIDWENMCRQIKAFLKPQEWDILNWRFGLENGCPPETLESIGIRLNISRERVRQIVRDILDKLKRRFYPEYKMNNNQSFELQEAREVKDEHPKSVQ